MAQYFKYIRPQLHFATSGPNYVHAYMGDPCPVRVNMDLSDWLLESFGGPSGFVRHGSKPTGPIVGPCDDFYTGDIPTTDPIVLTKYDRKGTMKFKDFKVAQAAGRVVLQPREVGEFLLHSVAGPSQPISNQPGQLVDWARFIEDVPGQPVADSCDWTGRYDMVRTLAGVPLDHPTRHLQNQSGLHRQTLFKMGRSYNVPSLILPTDDRVASAVAAQLHDKILIDRSLVTSAIAEANSGVYDLLTEIGEFKSTLSFVFGTLGEILRLSAQLKKDLFRAKARPKATLVSIADEISGLWMAYRYAVMPLAYSASDVLDYHSSTFTPFATVRKGSSESYDFDLPHGWVASAPIETVDRCYVKTRFGLDLALHGLKFNPLSTAWELVPLSFVVDWVINVGDLLSALVAPRGIAERGVQYSRQIREQTIVISRTDGYGGHYVLTGSSYNAEPITPLDHIGLSIDFSMSWKRWLDALALTWGMTKKSYIKGS